VFGAGENGPRAIPSFTRALAAKRRPVVGGDGSDVRDFVHVADVGAAFVNAVLRSSDDVDDSVLNVGSGRGRSTLEILGHVAGAIGTVADPEFAPTTRPPSRLVLDTQRATRALGLVARDDFERALAEEVNWLVEHVQED
jgi:nucleoside-diphosphate-sugar epimerase